MMTGVTTGVLSILRPISRIPYAGYAVIGLVSLLGILPYGLGACFTVACGFSYTRSNSPLTQIVLVLGFSYFHISTIALW